MTSRTSPAPTVESIKDGLAKLLREVRQLKSEVTLLTQSLNGFKSKHPLPPPAHASSLSHREQRTEEPRSAIRSINYEYKDNDNLEAPSRTLLAIAKDLDGALLDIRAARADISAIANDSDLREDFKDWQNSQ